MAEITVEYEQLGREHGLREGNGPRGPWARKPFLVAWDDRFQFANEIMGTSEQVTGGAWTRPLPHQYPESQNLFAQSVEIEPFDEHPTPTHNDIDPIRYENALVTVEYGIPPYNALPGQDPGWLHSLSQNPAEAEALLWATQELDFATELYTVPNTSLRYESDGATLQRSIQLRISVITMTITWHRYPVLPMGKLRYYIDSVNDATFLECERGTVFFLPARTVRDASADGRVTQKLQMTLKWRKQDWNKQPRVNASGELFWDIVEDTSGNVLFPYRDFSQILVPSRNGP